MSADTETRSRGGERGAARTEARLALVLVWSRSEPQRTGEVAVIPRTGSVILGRGEARPDNTEPRVFFRPPRGARRGSDAPLESTVLSRRQLVVSRAGNELTLERVGRLTMHVGGRE